MGASPAHNISPSSVAQARSPVLLGPLFSLTVNVELSAGNFPRSLPPHSQIRVLLPTSSATSLQFPVACIPPRNPVPFRSAGALPPRLRSDPIRNPVLSHLLGAFSGLRVRALSSSRSCSTFCFSPPADDVHSASPSAPSFS